MYYIGHTSIKIGKRAFKRNVYKSQSHNKLEKYRRTLRQARDRINEAVM